MKIVALLVVAGMVGAGVSGCGSSADESRTSPQQRATQTTGDKAIPAPAQSIASQQEQRKTQMDAMRAKDAQSTR
ncbi:MAG: hypothetical protein EOO81_12720 [Oxalobacteraceae bacterium]|nr:MAG: hypothetical protein EOO81_12720 [Oxalobacteraceae bacterium]